jgi:transcriptional regulator with XRE-family HTH domain
MKKQSEILNFNQVFRTVRIGLGQTQQEFAESLGITKNYVSLIECEKRKPSPRLLEVLAEKYELPVELFLALGRPRTGNDTAEVQRIEILVHQLLRLLGELKHAPRHD